MLEQGLTRLQCVLCRMSFQVSKQGPGKVKEHSWIDYSMWHGENFVVLFSVTQSCPTLCDPMDYSPPGSSVHGLLRQKYWSVLPCPPPGDLPNSGIELACLMSLALTGRFFAIEPPGKPCGEARTLLYHSSIVS